jgi:hypothetical protein
MQHSRGGSANRTLLGSPARDFVFAALVAVTLYFLIKDVLPLFSIQPARYGLFWDVRWWLVLHIVGGTVALLVAPVQLISAGNPKHKYLHRVAGFVYIGGIALAGGAGFYLALDSVVGWTVGLALMVLNLFWVGATGMAFYAAIERCWQEHRIWMIRSIIMTFGFVSFRFLRESPAFPLESSFAERTTASVWMAWVVPILVFEGIEAVNRIRKQSIRATADFKSHTKDTKGNASGSQAKKEHSLRLVSRRGGSI